MKRNDIKILFILHMILAGFSLSGVFTKMASAQPFLSMKFCICYGSVIVILGIYAIAWQQIIKRMPLTSAYANRAITVVWGIIWGMLFFKEQINMGEVIGALIVMAGVYLYVKADSSEESEANDE